MDKGILLSIFDNKQIFEKPVVFATTLLFLLCLITLRFSLNFRRHLKLRLPTCAFAIPILSFAGNALHIHSRPLPVLTLLTPKARKSCVEDRWGRHVIVSSSCQLSMRRMLPGTVSNPIQMQLPRGSFTENM